VSKAHVKPAVVSGPEGSVAVPVNVTPCPVNVLAGTAVSDATVGATFVIVTVACASVEAPSASVTRTFTVAEAGPSEAVYETDCPGVSNVPFPSRSHA
jgi:hypothetical protein